MKHPLHRMFLHHTVTLFGLVLDTYFATGPAFLILITAVDEKGKQLVHLITRATDNYVAYYDCADAKKGFNREIQFPRTFSKSEIDDLWRIKNC